MLRMTSLFPTHKTAQTGGVTKTRIAGAVLGLREKERREMEFGLKICLLLRPYLEHPVLMSHQLFIICSWNIS